MWIQEGEPLSDIVYSLFRLVCGEPFETWHLPHTFPLFITEHLHLHQTPLKLIWNKPLNCKLRCSERKSSDFNIFKDVFPIVETDRVGKHYNIYFIFYFTPHKSTESIITCFDHIMQNFCSVSVLKSNNLKIW